VRVLLLEAGGKDNHPLIHMPVGFAKMTSGPHTWGFSTAPQKHANNREIPYAQARVIGGGSSINAEVFTRGNPVDYDRWANEEGCDWLVVRRGPGVLSSARKATPSLRATGTAPTGRWASPTSRSAADDAGLRAVLPGIRHPYNPDFNGAVQEGCGRLPDHDPQRPPLFGRCRLSQAGDGPPNLTVEDRLPGARIEFEERRAIGVAYERADGPKPPRSRKSS
jgi:choline dehydrogenase-like flavoprotein